MKSLLRRQLAALAACLGLALPASATTFGPDYTDLWWNPAESGWGINLIQQYEVIFATMFVYGPDNTPHWFVASDMRGNQTSFSGTLYQTSGPAFSAQWTGTVNHSPVGNISIVFNGPNNGTLTYSVGNQTYVKQITRQTWRANNLAGNYIGGMTATSFNCANPADNGAALITGLFSVQHGGGQPVIRVDFRNAAGTPATCTFSGTYTPAGRLGTFSGSFSCTLGSQGTFTMSELDVTRNGFTSAFSGQDQFCSYNGYFGGTRDVL